MGQILILLKRKSSSLIRKIKKPLFFIRGFVGLYELKKSFPEKTICLVLTKLLGDSIYGMAYIDEIRRKYPDCQIVVIGSRNNEFFLKNYEGIDSLLFFTDLLDVTRKRLTALVCSSMVSEKGLQYGIVNTTPCFYDACYNSNNPDSLYQLRNHILNLPENAKITYPRFDKVEIKAIDNFDRDKERIVILNPYSNSLAGSQVKIFETIALALKGKGYRTFTNTVGEQKELMGTERLDCRIDELFAICRQIPAVISIRSGMLDAIVSSDVNIFAIYDQVDDKWMKIFSLKSWQCKGLIEEVYLNGDMKNCLNQFNYFLKKVEDA